MKDSTLWALVYIALGLLLAIVWSPALAPRVGLPLWIVFIGIWIDTALVLNIPSLIRHYARTWHLLRTGPAQANLLRVSKSDVILLMLFFVLVPLAVLLWALLRWFA